MNNCGCRQTSTTRKPLAKRVHAAWLWAVLFPAPAWAAVTQADLTTHWSGYAALALFGLAYLLVVAEEFTGLRKSQPVMLAAGAIWSVLAVASAALGQSKQLHEAVGHYLLEYAQLLLFLLAAMTYVNAMSERGLFEALRAWLLRKGLGYRALFWSTGTMAFFISPFIDNLTTALVMCARTAGSLHWHASTLSSPPMRAALSAHSAISPR